MTSNLTIEDENMSLISAPNPPEDFSSINDTMTSHTEKLDNQNHSNNIHEPLIINKEDNNHPNWTEVPSIQSEEDETQKRVDASVFSSILNLSNTILGAGILALPFAMAKCGIFLGIF